MCHKIPYQSKKQALKAIHAIQHRRHTTHCERRCYHCKCGAWHLTSQ